MADGFYYCQRAVASLRSGPVLAGLCAATGIAAVAWTLNDYASWRAFGTGGTPPTWAGYWRMTKIRISHALSSNDLLDPSSLSTTGPAYLTSPPIPSRAGPRPRIMPRILPQRQRPEPVPAATRERLASLMRTLQGAHPDLLEVRPSHTEGKSTDGLYARQDVPTLNPVADDRILQREIAHAHPVDNSLHVWLSDQDARAVIEAGWGQRFPLTFVQSGWVMVYAPREEAEVDIVERIVRAGVAWVTGVEI